MEKLSYEESIQSLGARSLSCNHTFKVSVNVGFQSQSSNSWITQYDSLFMVLNEYGQVLGFEFVKSTAFSNIQPLLQKIKDFLRTKVDMIILDNCCQWNKKISTIFPEAKIKLDLFHAVQRIMKCISMKSEYRAEITKSLRAVFRQNNDGTKERKFQTPDKDDIERAFKSFEIRWADINDEHGTEIFNNSSKRACCNLLRHIQKGCLSNIPPGIGTNRNERLHKFLNDSALAIGRIGPELAKALLWVLLYKWNCLRSSTTQGLFYPVWSSFHHENKERICFFGQGIQDRKQTNNPQQIDEKSTDYNNSVQLSQSEENVVKETENFCRVLNGINFSVGCVESLLWANDKTAKLLRAYQSDRTNECNRQLELNASKLNICV